MYTSFGTGNRRAWAPPSANTNTETTASQTNH